MLRSYEVPPWCDVEVEVVTAVRTGPYMYDYT